MVVLVKHGSTEVLGKLVLDVGLDAACLSHIAIADKNQVLLVVDHFDVN